MRYNPVSWRLAAVLAVCTAAVGCQFDGADEAASNDDLGAECWADSDCEPASSGCCGCATFSQPVARGFGASCEDVDCPPSAMCAATAAQCDSGTCVLACEELTCELSCEVGFVVDEAGCQSCECAPEPLEPLAPECIEDTDCVRVPADCCGCELGGVSTAVAVDLQSDYSAALECGQELAMCPGVNTCNPEDTVICVFGACALGQPL